MIFKHSWIKMTVTLVILLGCRERIFLDTLPEDFQLIAINGLIDSSEGPYFIAVQETRSANRAPIPVEEALVELVDDLGNREVCPYFENGTYQCAGNVVQGNSGVAYHIEVRLGADLYQSVPEVMPAILGTNRLEWEETGIPTTTASGIDVVTTMLDFDLIAALPDVTEPVFLQWQLLETFQIRPTDFPDPFGFIPPPCFITQNIGIQNFYTLALNEFANPIYTIPSVIQREIDNSFVIKHIFSIHQSSVTETYFNYLEQTRTLTEATGSLFDPPAGRVIGNIMHEGSGLAATGYFAAVAKDTTHMVIYREEIETPIDDVCLYNQFKPVDDYPRTCLDCSIIPRSTYEEPYWWSRVQ